MDSLAHETEGLTKSAAARDTVARHEAESPRPESPRVGKLSVGATEDEGSDQEVSEIADFLRCL